MLMAPFPGPSLLFDKATGNANISNSEVAFLGYYSILSPQTALYFSSGGNGSSIS